MSKGRVENLTPFGPDNPPPAKGRPKGSRNVSTVLREMLARQAPETVIGLDFIKSFCRGKKRVTSADAAAARILYEALVNGEQWAVKELVDRTEGKAKDRTEQSSFDYNEADLSVLNAYELERIIAGDDPRSIFAAARARRIRETAQAG